ncbi:unnamed protein product, partial [Heterotrigona itama]
RSTSRPFPFAFEEILPARSSSCQKQCTNIAARETFNQPTRQPASQPASPELMIKQALYNN